MNKPKVDITKGMLNGIIFNDLVAREMRDMTRRKLEELYELAKANRVVWKGKGVDNRWKFKRPGQTPIFKKSEEDIKEAYISYISGQLKNEMSFKELFFEWISHKENVSGLGAKQIKPSTIKRYVNDYSRFIKGSSFEKKKISEISTADIERLLHRIVKTHSITTVCFNNVVGYIKGAFFFARKEKYLIDDPCFLLELAPIRGCCEDIIKNDTDITVSDEEAGLLIKAIREDIKKHPLYMPNYAILLAFLTGMRIGELAALKWHCVRDGRIYIDYSEHRIDYRDKPSEIIIGEPKCRKHRVIPITPTIQALFDEINAVQKNNKIKATFVFEDKKKRYTAAQIGNCIRHRCENAGIPNKCIHDIRRTVSAKLKLSLPVSSVSAILGHTEETNGLYYNPDILSEKNKSDALSGLWKSHKSLINTSVVKSVTECYQPHKKKGKTRNPVIIRFPA